METKRRVQNPPNDQNEPILESDERNEYLSDFSRPCTDTLLDLSSIIREMPILVRYLDYNRAMDMGNVLKDSTTDDEDFSLMEYKTNINLSKFSKWSKHENAARFPITRVHEFVGNISIQHPGIKNISLEFSNVPEHPTILEGWQTPSGKWELCTIPALYSIASVPYGWTHLVIKTHKKWQEFVLETHPIPDAKLSFFSLRKNVGNIATHSDQKQFDPHAICGLHWGGYHYIFEAGTVSSHMESESCSSKKHTTINQRGTPNTQNADTPNPTEKSAHPSQVKKKSTSHSPSSTIYYSYKGVVWSGPPCRKVHFPIGASENFPKDCDDRLPWKRQFRSQEGRCVILNNLFCAYGEGIVGPPRSYGECFEKLMSDVGVEIDVAQYRKNQGDECDDVDMVANFIECHRIVQYLD
jgi:hypothetical protein